MLGCIFTYPQTYEEVVENLIDNLPFDKNTERFYNSLKKVYTLESSIDLERVKSELSQEDGEKINILSLFIEENYPDFSEDAARLEVKKLIREINRSNLYSVQKNYEFKIRSTEDTQEKKLLLSKYNEILKLKTKI